jgi:anti-sigma regulatory factor (Ser/Thr protein kinase)
MPRAPKLTLNQAMTWATNNVSAHSKDFSRAFAQRFGLTRAGAAPFIHTLEKNRIIKRSGSSTRPTFSAGPRQFLQFSYGIPGIDESQVWEHDIAPHLHLAKNVANVTHFALTEMINNANDHSEGSIVSVTVDCQESILAMYVRDDGIGVFKKISDALCLPDFRQALLELSKGKFTTAPQEHSGEGIFFTSRAVDLFHLMANELLYEYHRLFEELPSREVLQELQNSSSKGTWVTMVIRKNSSTVLKDVFDHYTTDAPDDMTFSKTVVPVRLARVGSENLISRSQAKRLLARVDQFKNVQLDFSEVPEIGQAFADEIFRVFALAHPEIVLEAVNANPDVQRMIKRALQTKVQGA